MRTRTLKTSTHAFTAAVFASAIILLPHGTHAQQVPPTVSLTASPTSITLGGSSTLSWSSTDATSCTGEGFSTGGATAGSISVSPQSYALYDVTCTGPGGTAFTPQVSVTVPYVDLTVEYIGNSTKLSWDSRWVTSCTSTNFPTGDALTGFAYVTPSVNTTYSIACNGSDSTVSDSVYVPTGTVTLTASPNSITYGEFTTLTWSSTGATQCISSQPYQGGGPSDWTKNTSFWLGPGGPTSGSIAVAPWETTSYTVTCNVHAGMRYVTVDVIPPPSPPTVDISASPTSIFPADASVLTWSSTGATSCTGEGFSTGGATSGSVSVSPGATTNYRVTCTGPGGSASLEAVVIVILPSCTVTLDASAVPYGTGTYLRWSAANTSSLYIANVGYVSPDSGSIMIAPSTTTSYPASCAGVGGTVAPSNGTQTLTVTPPSIPTATITAESTGIAVGLSTTIHASFAVASSDALTAANIDEPLGTGRSASTAPGLKSYVFTPTSAGTYTFYARATTQYYSSWATYNSVSVTVIDAAPGCSFDASPASITLGQTVTVTWGCSSATSCAGTDFSTGGATSGSIGVIPNSPTTYSISCVGADGGTYSDISSDSVAVTCAPLYSCSGSNITYTNVGCDTVTVATCASPSFCTAGQSSCQWSEIIFTPFSSVLSGHLQAQPAIIRKGDRTRLYWQVTGAQSCAVSGGGQNWTGLSSGSSGAQTNPLTQPTRYTMHCVAHPGQTDITETFDVLVTPQFHET